MDTDTQDVKPTPAPSMALSILETDFQRLQGELQTLMQRKQEIEQARTQIDTAIVAQRGAIGYVEMVLQRVNGNGAQA